MRSRRRGERLRPVRSELTDILADPVDGEALSLDAAESDGDEIVSGTLRGESGREYPIRNGIPRFVDVHDAGQAQTQSSFGFKWTSLSCQSHFPHIPRLPFSLFELLHVAICMGKLNFCG